jgi:hypothetical protein
VNLRTHPDVVADARAGAKNLLPVRAEYLIENNLLLGRGPTVDWIAPFIHKELPGELAQLRAADGEPVLRFARRYGCFGYGALPTSRPLTDRARFKRATYVVRTGPLAGQIQWPGGDPLPWIRAHAFGVHLCLQVTDALTSTRDHTLKTLLDSFFSPVVRRERLLGTGKGLLCGSLFGDRGDLKDVGSLRGWNWAGPPRAIARKLRAEIISTNLRLVQRYIDVDLEQKGDRSFYGGPLLGAVYWHLANVIDKGTVRRCAADGCGAYFITTDPRQRYCPPRDHQRESSCAIRQRQRQWQRA